MKKLLFSSLVVSCWIGTAPVLRAQGTLTVPPPNATPQVRTPLPQSTAQRVTLDVDASAQKATKQKAVPKASKAKTEKKLLKPKAGTTTERTTGQ